MIMMIAHFKVKDYAVWRAVFDELAPVRKRYEQTGERVLQSVEDPNQITVILEWRSAEGAQKYIESPELKEGSQRSGPVGQVTLHMLKEAD